MARGLGRSKGCQTCLQRKIKCDEKTPSCTQCARGGRQCSGALSTVFLIVESETVNSNPTYKPRDTETRDERYGPLVRRPKETGPSSRKAVRRRTQPTQLDNQVLPPTVSPSNVVADQFLSHFITFFSKVTARQVIFNSWMTALPDMLAAKSPFVQEAIIAASTVYVGRESGDAGTVVESYKWYGLGIAKQRKLLEELQRDKRLPTVEEICTPILLSFFEITCNSSPTGYFQHLMGAARFLEMRGPEECSSGTFHQLFLTLRIQLIHPAIVMRIPSVFAAEEWLTIPFQHRSKSVFDKVIDAIIIISGMLCRLEACRFMKKPSEAEIEKEYIRTEATKIKEQMDRWWDEELREASRNQGWNGDYYRGVPGFDFDYDCLNSDDDCGMVVDYSEKSSESGSPTSAPRQFLRFYTETRATAFYSTARILTLWILNELDAPPALFKEQMQAHSESIIYVSTFLTDMDIGYAYIRLALPLTLVATLSPFPCQRRRARNVLERWRTKGGVAGLCEVVLSGLPEETSDSLAVECDTAVD